LLQDLELQRRELELQNEELRQAQEQLTVERARYFDLYDLAPDGYCTVSATGLLTEVNLTAARILGADRRALSDHPIFSNFVLEDDRSIYRRHRQQLLDTDAPQVFELRMLRIDDTPFWAQLRATVVKDSEGAPTIRVMISDINMRKQAEDDLRKKEMQLKATLESTADGILAVDASGKVLHASRRFAELFRIPQTFLDQGDDRALLKFVLDQLSDPAAFLKKVEQLYQSDASDMDTIAFSDGRLFERYSLPMVTDGVNVGRVWSFRDITERRRLEADKEKLEIQNRKLQKNESLGRMAGAIAHRFNNHLMAVMGNLELALEETPRNNGLFKTLSSSLYAAGQAVEVSRSMLTYLGQTPVKHVLLDFSAVCRQSLQSLSVNIPKSMDVKFDLPDPGPAVSADAAQIQQVMANLVTNAWESYGATGGIIRLSVKTVLSVDMPVACWVPAGWQPQEHAYACLEVADEGCGIESKDLEKIFDPFFTTKFTGRGMGLAMVVGIVQTHGGGLEVESQPGRGCIVRVFFPLETEVVSQPLAQPAPARQTEAGGLILLIEDDESVRKVATRMMECSGFTVLAASDGVEGLEVFRQHQAEICCVLCDLTVPRMGGWETLTAIRALHPGMPVILASGYDEAEVMAGDHPEKPQVFLGKPYQMQALRDAISNAVNAR
ncbi:MAG: ATP-binding protein, partial [bacterium]